MKNRWTFENPPTPILILGGPGLRCWFNIFCFPKSLCGVLVLDSVSRLRLARHLCHTPSFTFHTPLCHPPSFTHNFVTHHLSNTHTHTTLSPTIFHTQLCHPPSLTHNFVTHYLWCRGTLRGRRGTWCHPPSFHVACVALGDIHLHFAWQAWYLWHWAGSGGALGRALVARGAAPLCVAVVALGDIHPHFAGQACTWWHWLSICVAGVALGDIHLHLGVVLGDIHLRFVWQAWHLVTSTFT